MTDRKVYLFVQSVLCVLTAAVMIFGMLSLYQEGMARRAADPLASIYSRQILADYFTRIAPLFFATLGAALAGILLGVKDERADLPSRNPPAARVKDPNPPMPTGAKPASKDRRAVWQIALLVLAVLFIVLGILNGSMKDVLIKAINICTECIGLG